LGLRLRLRLSRGRGCWHLHDCTTRACLGDGCWHRLYTLAGGYRYATCNNRGGGDAEPSPSDEIASGDNRPSVLFSWLRTDRLGRLLAR
jgi:hypothetical protein